VGQRAGYSLPNNCGSSFASAVPAPRRADASRSWCVCVCASQKSQIRRRTNGTRTGAGGVSPPWLRYRDCNGVRQHVGRQCAEQSRKRLCKCVSRPTAGSHPPLLVRVRLCIAKVAIPPAAERHANKSGGRNRPRGCTNAIATAFLSALVAVSRTIAGVPLDERFREPRRAHVRRSWLAVRRLCADMYVIVPATRFPKPRRAYTRRSWR